MTRVTIQEARAKLPEGVITENNQSVAKLASEKPAVGERPQPGLCKGMITIVADDDEDLKDFAEYML